MVLIFIFYILLIFLVHKMKINFNKFLNFVGIIPIQYLREDTDFFNDILRLEKNNMTGFAMKLDTVLLQ